MSGVAARRATCRVHPAPSTASPNPRSPVARTGRNASPPVERIVLLGFMTSGKSTVGAALARRLEWAFVDFDVEIERREGRPIRAIVETDGEEALRAMEASLTGEVADSKAVVLAPGGGWILHPEHLERLRRGTLSVWLRISADEAVRRLREDGGDRPLRDHPDPRAAVAEMLAEREPLYRLADLCVPAEGRSVESIAFEIEGVVRARR
jgi:shikimate kinase